MKKLLLILLFTNGSFFSFASFNISYSSIFSEPDTSTIEQTLKTGMTLKKQAEFHQAIPLLNEASEHFFKEKNWEKYIQTKVNVAYSYLSLDSIIIAEQMIDKLLLEGNKYLEAPHHQIFNIQESKVKLLRLHGKYPEALALANEVIEGRKALLGDMHNSLSKMYQEASFIYSTLSNYELANDYAKKSILITERNFGFNHDKTANGYWQLGNKYNYQGKPKEAIQNYEKTLRIRMNLYGEHSLEVANSYVMMGSSYCRIKNCDKGEEVLGKAVKIYKDILGEDNNDVGVAHLNFSTFYFYVPDYEKLIYHAKEAVKIFEKSSKEKSINHSYALSNIALGYSRLGDHANALDAQQDALEFFSTNYKAKDIYDLPNLDQYQIHSFALEMIMIHAAFFDDYYMESNDEQHLKGAYEAYNLAAQGVDRVQSIYHSSSKPVFHDGLARSIHSGVIRNAYNLFEKTNDETYVAQAFNFLEKSHASQLYAAIQNQEANDLAFVPDDLLENEKSLKTKISDLKKKLYRVNGQEGISDDTLFVWQNNLLDSKEALRKLTSQLESEHPDYYELKYNLDVGELGDLQKKLPPSTSLIEYFFDEEYGEVYALVVEKESTHFQKMRMPLHIEDTIRSFIQLIKDPKIAENQGANLSIFQKYIRQSQQISALLIDSLQFSKENDLVIIPDGILHYLPFENLLTEEVKNVETVNYAQLPYLLKRQNIRYAYSATLLFFKEKNDSNSSEILAFAPDYNGSQNKYLATRTGFSPLAHTAKEVQNIYQLVGGKTFIGFDATESIFKKNALQSKIIHFAMHAFTNEDDPLYSGLVFTDTDDDIEDNTLHAYELYNLELNSDLVVLSACNTGSGKLAKGEGVMSLARAFRHAGCPNIVMSLWQADDEATSMIMQDFYKNLKNGKGKDEALRHAKLSYLKSSPKTFPHYWGAFVLMGDGAEVDFGNDNWRWILGVGGLLLLGLIWFFRKNN